MLTNRRDLRSRAKYRLLQQERVHTGESDVAFGAMFYGPDEEGHTGIALTKDIPPEASKAINKVLRLVTPGTLTWPQKLQFTGHWLRTKLRIGEKGGEGKGTKIFRGGEKEEGNKVKEGTKEQQQEGAAAATATSKNQNNNNNNNDKKKKDRWLGWAPDYTQCIDHFILHAGGYGVLKGIQKVMKLPSDVLLPSFATLRDIGNTSSSSTWYTFAYLESVSSGVKRGQKLLQLGVGGGMKASAAVWKCLRDSREPHPVWDHLQRKPVQHEELPRPIDETRESAAAVAAEVAKDTELLAAARDAERSRARAEAAAAAAAAHTAAAAAPAKALAASASTGALRADSANDDEIERALSRPGSVPPFEGGASARAVEA